MRFTRCEMGGTRLVYRETWGWADEVEEWRSLWAARNISPEQMTGSAGFDTVHSMQYQELLVLALDKL